MVPSLGLRSQLSYGVFGLLLIALSSFEPCFADVSPLTVAGTAQAISVRIEGATGGSGVIIERSGNQYTVITAWHVIESNKPGEDVEILTSDGVSHRVDPRTFKRLSGADLGLVSFVSKNSYRVAEFSSSRVIKIGEKIYVAGYPLPTSSMPVRSFRLLTGDVVGNEISQVPDGYQLMYSAPTLEGMSGGAVLDSNAQVIAIHGRGEIDIKLSERHDIAVKTGTNQGILLSDYFLGSMGIKDSKASVNFGSVEKRRNSLLRKVIKNGVIEYDVRKTGTGECGDLLAGPMACLD